MSKPKKSKRFQYSLEILLKVRGIREKEEQDRFNAAIQKLIEEQEKERQIKDFQDSKYDELAEKISGRGRKPTNVQDVMMRQAHLEVLKTQVEEQEKTREDAEEAKEEQRVKVIQAVREKRIIEIDKDKRRIEWKKLMDKEVGKFLDEISSISYARKRMEAEL